jgi:hypothetical protein
LQQSVKTSGSSYVTGFGLRFPPRAATSTTGSPVVPAIEYWQKVVKLPDLGVNEVRQSDWRIGGDLRYRLGDASAGRRTAGRLALDIVHSASGPPAGRFAARDPRGLGPEARAQLLRRRRHPERGPDPQHDRVQLAPRAGPPPVQDQLRDWLRVRGKAAAE